MLAKPLNGRAVHERVGPRIQHDGVLAVGGDGDVSGTGADTVRGSYRIGTHAAVAQVFDHAEPCGVAADGPYHRNFRTGCCRRDRLICALAAGQPFDALRRYGLSGLNAPAEPEDHILVDGADDHYRLGSADS